MVIPPMMVVCGAVGGVGVALLVRELWPAPPDLGSALDRLSGKPGPRRPPGSVDPAGESAWPGEEDPGRPSPFMDGLVDAVQHVPGVSMPYRDLELTGQSVARFVRNKVLMAMFGLLLPALLSAFLTVIGVSLPFELPLVVSLGVAALMWFVPDWALRDQAKAARLEFRHAAAAYLDLVALERAGDAGPAEALERAAAVGDGWAFRRIQDALARARVGTTDPWHGLRELAQDLELPELGDVADIVELSGTEGAAVYGTLRERARSLRVELLATEHEAANQDSERLVVPGTLLVMVMTVLLGFPAVYRMFAGA